ncbi:hypothetical protein B0H13DRAFT_2267621 [Mycena leptocephala]|nr:hypothetical protein B0H13DRAFT_2267621 [Mycena leptocephala]
MGLDLPVILLVIWWRSTCDMCTVWQRLGRAARALNLLATGLFLIEPKRFDDNIRKAKERAVKRAAASKKRKEVADRGEQSPVKPPAAGGSSDEEPGNLDILGPVLLQSIPTIPALASSSALNLAADARLHPPANTTSTSNSALVDASHANYTLERHAIYDAVAFPTPQWRKQTKKKGADKIEPALDNFINASARQQPDLPACVFLEPSTSETTRPPDLEGGCERCKVAPASICCELCTPDQFLDFTQVDLPKTKQQRKRSRVADYKADRIDFALEADLHAFRKACTIELRGHALVLPRLDSKPLAVRAEPKISRAEPAAESKLAYGLSKWTFVWQQGLDSFGFPPRQYGRRDWREGLTL